MVKVKLRYILLLAVVAIIAYGVYASMAPSTGKYDDFAQCLTEKGFTMYGAYWCPHCANQKAMFGSSFKYVNSVECDPNGNNPQPQLCQQKGITGYPTWIYNDQRLSGEQSIESLSILSGCPLS
jgi:glutaredoxin